MVGSASKLGALSDRWSAVRMLALLSEGSAAHLKLKC